MSNNARVVDGGEIGVAQYLQARAAGVEPDVRMNPILVKPEGDDRSQVVVLGKVDHVAQPEDVDASVRRRCGRVAKRRSTSCSPSTSSSCSRAPAARPRRISGRPTCSNMRAAHEARRTRRARGGHRPRRCVRASPGDVVAGHPRGRPRSSTGSCSTSSVATRRCSRLRRTISSSATGMRYVGAAARSSPTGCRTRTAPHHPIRRPGPAASGSCATRPRPTSTSSSCSSRWPTSAGSARPSSLAALDLVVLPGSKHVAADLDWLRRSGVPQSRRSRRGRASGSRHLRRPPDARYAAP